MYTYRIYNYYGVIYYIIIITFFVTRISGKWNVPIIKGERPPPLSRFTLEVLPNDRSKAVLFGGRIVTEKHQSHLSADLYFLTLSSDTVVSIS